MVPVDVVDRTDHESRRFFSTRIAEARLGKILLEEDYTPLTRRGAGGGDAVYLRQLEDMNQYDRDRALSPTERTGQHESGNRGGLVYLV